MRIHVQAAYFGAEIFASTVHVNFLSVELQSHGYVPSDLAGQPRLA